MHALQTVYDSLRAAGASEESPHYYIRKDGTVVPYARGTIKSSTAKLPSYDPMFSAKVYRQSGELVD
jgi:hypothetical protein